MQELKQKSINNTMVGWVILLYSFIILVLLFLNLKYVVFWGFIFVLLQIFVGLGLILKVEKGLKYFLILSGILLLISLTETIYVIYIYFAPCSNGWSCLATGAAIILAPFWAMFVILNVLAIWTIKKFFEKRTT